MAACASYPIVGGLVTLVGWSAGLPRLTNWKNDGISMFPNAALCAIATGVALLLISSGRFANRRSAAIPAVFVVAVALATLLQHLSGSNFGIDTLLFSAPPWGQLAAASPMRMGPPASTSFLLVGAALLLLGRGETSRRAAVSLGLVVIGIATLSLTGHLYGATQMYTLPHLTGIAMQTASMILAIGLGVVASVPERDPMRVALEPSAAGILARRALPLAIVLSMTLGFLRVQLQAQGLVDTAFGTALRTLLEIVLLSGLLWWALGLIRSHEGALRTSETKLRRHADVLSAFLETAAIPMHRIAADGTILWANDTELRCFGYAAAEYVGRNIRDFHVDASSADVLLDRLHRGEEVREFPSRIRCADGSMRDVLIDTTWFREGDRLVHVHCFLRDITERVRGDETRALIASIVQASPDAVVSKTLEGIVTSWNPGAEKLFGYTAEEMVGRSIETIIPDARRSEEKEILARLRRGESIEHFETMRRTKDGRLLHISLTISPVRDSSGRIIGASKIGRDISDRKRAEAEREEASRRKDEFIAILAHELRNPLAPVRNAAHYLRSLSHDGLRRPVEMIERQVAQMSRLIDDLLDVSRMSRGVLELKRETVASAVVVEAALEACRQEFEAKGQQLELVLPPDPLQLDADRERLVQVLTNLVGNASRYTPAGGKIHLSVAAHGSTLEIRVRDDGIGIPPERLTDIFELFTRLDQSLERQGGLGIGLTLAKQIVELHGGTIEARSRGIGCGSEFVVTLPVIIAATVSASGNGRPPRLPGAPRRVLIADDNRDAAESLAMLLGFAGHDVHTAFDGEEAMSRAASLRPDLALIDIGMPKANGYEVARRIRSEPWGSAIRLVALTGWGQESDRRRAREAGFDQHLVKPVSPETIEEMLHSLPPRVADDGQDVLVTAAAAVE